MTNEELQQLRERLQVAEQTAIAGKGISPIHWIELADAQRAITELLELRGKSDDDYR